MNRVICQLGCAITLLGMFLPCGLAQQPASAALRIRDHGHLRRYVIATDEIYQLGHQKGLQRIKGAKDEAELRARLRQLHRANQPALLVLYPADGPRNRFTRRCLTRLVRVRVAGGVDVEALANQLGARIVRPSHLPASAKGWTLLLASEPDGALDLCEQLRAQPGVIACEPLLARELQRKFIPNDPLFGQQWHLHNRGFGGGVAGIDLGVTNVWDTLRGTGVIVGVVDDGLEAAHPDLAPNVNTTLGYDYVDGDNDANPANLYWDTHGTQVAGLIGARGNNAVGVSGVAPEATLVGIRLLGDVVSDLQEAQALCHSNDVIMVMNNSWGASDGTGDLEGPGPLAQAALQDGVENGRQGKGIIYVFAGGNGLASGDNVNYDGYANSIYTIAVGAVSDQGKQASYSEPGACLVVCAPSSSVGHQRITTTDLQGTFGEDAGDYNFAFGGTSASTPMVAGVVALMLQANPELGWRDVQEILMRTARVIDASDPGWVTNSAGFHFNDKYGAGLVNAEAAVQAASTWQNLPPATVAAVESTNLMLSIPDGNPIGVNVTFDLSNSYLRVEHVALTVNITHNYRDDLTIRLIDPTGLESRLVEQNGLSGSDIEDWTFTSVRHWGQSSTGLWTVNIADSRYYGTGQVHSLRLEIHGTPLPAPAPPALSISRNNQSVTVTLSGTPGRQYVLEGSTNLASWENLATLVTTNGTATFTDSTAESAYRFYRAREANP